MPRLTAKVVLWIAVFAVTGCGTIGNLQDRDKIYGGVRLDGKEAWRAGKELIKPGESPDYTTKQDTAILVYACVDTPLSLIADTFTLPITVTKSVIHWVKGPDHPADPQFQPTDAQVITTAEPPLPNKL